MQPSDFIHPEDAAALRQLENIPGFAAIVKKILAVGYESLQYGINMASLIRLSEVQLPHIYNHLPPICHKLGIAEPELYLEMSPYPNAYTYGDTRICITLTSSLIETMNNDELDSVIAHECGHILCHHVLYHTIALWLKKGLDSLGLLGNLGKPLEYALAYWSRKSELSADRAACIVTSPQIVASTMARLSGGLGELNSQINLDAWTKQADEYDIIKNDGTWNKTLQIIAIAALDHPFAAVRVREILKWGESVQYRMIKEGSKVPLDHRDKCPNCGTRIDTEWKFCKNCGYKLY